MPSYVEDLMVDNTMVVAMWNRIEFKSPEKKPEQHGGAKYAPFITTLLRELTKGSMRTALIPWRTAP
jgi:hypothetical protein